MYSTFSIVVLAVTLGISASAGAQRIDDKGRALTGIGPIGIVVEDIEGNIERYGLTRELLHNSADSSLRRNGVPITKSSTSPFIYVHTVTLRLPDRAAFVYCINIELKQPNITIKPNAPWMPILTTIWERGTIGYVPFTDSLPGVVRNAVLEYVDKFSLAYLRANPTSKKNPLDAVKP